MTHDRENQLREQIEQIIVRLKRIQKQIGGSRQPASTLELESLKELGRRYAELDRELKHYLGQVGDE